MTADGNGEGTGEVPEKRKTRRLIWLAAAGVAALAAGWALTRRGKGEGGPG